MNKPISEFFDPQITITPYFSSTEELKTAHFPLKKICFGHETCELKLFLNDSYAFYDLACKKNLKICWLTPPVKELFWEKLEKWISTITNMDPQPEITVNDLGVLHYLNKTGIKCTLNLGRLLHKQIKDLRFYQKIHAGVDSMDSSWPVDDLHFQKFLKQNGIHRVCFDHIPYLQTGIRAQNQSFFRGTLFYPFILLSTGKNCLLKNIGHGVEKNCSKFCDEFELEITKYKQMPLLLKNNALFYKNLILNSSLLEKGIDEVVIPYWWLAHDTQSSD